MSIKAINWAWSLDSLDMPKGYVLMALADAANDDGYCWPSQEELARKSKQSARSVRRHISVLVDLGLRWRHVCAAVGGTVALRMGIT